MGMRGSLYLFLQTGPNITHNANGATAANENTLDGRKLIAYGIVDEKTPPGKGISCDSSRSCGGQPRGKRSAVAGPTLVASAGEKNEEETTPWVLT